MPVTIATAQVPPPQSDRFPMQSVITGNPGPPIDAFYALPAEQDWVDYSNYESDLVSQRILAAVQAVRTGMKSNRLISVHNGYLIELMGSFSGHFSVNQLLSSSYIDSLAGGLTPYDRLAGGAGQEGVPVDSVNANGKVWLNVTDLNTYLAANSIYQSGGLSNPPTADLTETVDVLDRETASNLVHRSGNWWFDLNENGAFMDPNIWTPMSIYGIPLFNQLYANPQPYKADVALIIDRNSIFYQKSDEDMMIAQRAALRYALFDAAPIR